MNSFEINKIITAILVTILVVFGIGKISDMIFDKDEKNIVAYKVESLEGAAGEANATETNVDLNALFAMADVAHGENVFKKCGFKVEGIKLKDAVLEGNRVDVIIVGFYKKNIDL
mgnify:CR=1 FL=1